MDEKPSLSDAVDTTDCLEAIGAFKAMKNLFFMVAFIALIVLQGVFWLNYLGYIDVSEVSEVSAEPAAAVVDVEPTAAEATEPETGAAIGFIVGGEAKNEATIEKQAEKVVADVTEGEKAVDGEVEAAESETGALIGAVVGGTVNDVTIEKQAEKVVADVTEGDKTVDAEVEAAPVEEAAPAKKALNITLTKFMPKYEHACVAIRLCNFVLIISATIYCLILLMSIKISLIGRLGGISHISKAFFLSLFALIILLPWQGLFEGVVLGAIYLPAELFSKFVLTDESTLVCKIMYFARFSGMWGLSLLLLLCAQLRSAKWSKTTLRRLGILR
jgi:hypothetical protein